MLYNLTHVLAVNVDQVSPGQRKHNKKAREEEHEHFIYTLNANVSRAREATHE